MQVHLTVIVLQVLIVETSGFYTGKLIYIDTIDRDYFLVRQQPYYIL